MVGQFYENLLDSYFNTFHGIRIEKVNAYMQMNGVDRIFHEPSLFKVPVEYKTDLRAAETNNFFFESRLENSNGKIKPGWFYKSYAQELIIYVPQKEKAYVWDFHHLRRRIAKANYPESNTWAENDNGLSATGFLVPAVDIVSLARVYEIPCSYLEGCEFVGKR